MREKAGEPPIKPGRKKTSKILAKSVKVEKLVEAYMEKEGRKTEIDMGS